MSSVKRSHKNKDVQYVEGRLSVGKEVCRFVSFDVKIKDEIDKMKENGVDSVILKNCAIKKSRMGECSHKLVLSKQSSVVSLPPKKFKLPENNLKKCMKEKVLEKLECIEGLGSNVGNKVGVKGKIVSVKKEEGIRSRDGSKVFTK